MRTVAEANKYMSDQAPWKIRESDPDRMRTVMHVVLQLVDDAKTLFTPFLPRSSDKVHRMLGGSGAWSGMPEIRQVDEDDAPSYPVITGDYGTAARWESQPIVAGTPLAVPTPLFTKLDPSVVDEELARLEQECPLPAPPARPVRPVTVRLARAMSWRPSRCPVTPWTATATW